MIFFSWECIYHMNQNPLWELYIINAGPIYPAAPYIKQHNVIFEKCRQEKCLCFHLQFPPGLWMDNRQAPENQPASSTTNQPLAVFQSKCVHSAHFPLPWTESSCCSVVCPKMWREIVLVASQGSTYCDVQELCWHILLHFLVSLKHENVTYIIAADDSFCSFILPRPLGSCVSLLKGSANRRWLLVYIWQKDKREMC